MIKVLKTKKKVWNSWRKMFPSDPDLGNADLRDADLRGADLNNAYLRGAYLGDTDLCDADLGNAYLRDADLRGSDLRNADLNCADLRDADLRGAYLGDADLGNADLSNADLDFSALFLGCKSLKAKFDEKHIIQILYHAIKPCVENKIVKDPDLKKLLNSKMFQKVVNKFHRAECGKIEGAVK